jgi:hypothetical protein
MDRHSHLEAAARALLRTTTAESKIIAAQEAKIFELNAMIIFSKNS